MPTTTDKPTVGTTIEEIREARAKARSDGEFLFILSGAGYQCTARDIAVVLLAEVDRLTEQWNTRFDTLCGLCGNRYHGPRDNDKHGYGKCG